MGLAKKLKDLLGTPPKERKKGDKTAIVIPLPKDGEKKSKTVDDKVANEKDKAAIEVMQKQIQKKLRDDPEAAKKAAQIVTEMLNKGPKK